jgi:hypothetical protein
MSNAEPWSQRCPDAQQPEQVQRKQKKVPADFLNFKIRVYLTHLAGPFVNKSAKFSNITAIKHANGQKSAFEIKAECYESLLNIFL